MANDDQVESTVKKLIQRVRLLHTAAMVALSPRHVGPQVRKTSRLPNAPALSSHLRMLGFWQEVGRRKAAVTCPLTGRRTSYGQGASGGL